MEQPQGDLARAVNHEMNDDWPHSIEIVAYYGKDRRGTTRRVVIEADEFFGRGGYSAPLSGDQLIRIIDKLRKGPR